MIHRAIKILTFSFVLCALILGGCGNFDADAVRREHVEIYRRTISEKTEKVLSDSNSLCLDDCIQIALQHNLRIRTSEIQKRIAQLEKKVAFSYFLPSVNLNYGYTKWDRQPKVKFGSDAAAMHDKSVRDITWQIQMSIFDPSTWFMYSMHQRGEEIAELVTEYTKQMTVLEITVMYFHCLGLQEIEKALTSQVTAATALEKQLRAFYEEGLVSKWQAEQSEVMAVSRRTDLHRTQYALSQAKADLLTTMGLSPLADISLEVQTPLNEPGEPLEELIAEALIVHPQLKIADREIAIEKEKVKVAIAGFLPNLIGFANRTHSSDSFMLYPDYWTVGLAGTISLFNGFANVNEYKAAKEHQKEAFIQREEATMTLILEVVKAHLNLKNAREEMILARKAFGMSSKHFVEIQQQWQEGLVDSAEMLSVLAEKDRAQMGLMNARFQLQVTTATLLNVMGKTNIEIKEQENEI